MQQSDHRTAKVCSLIHTFFCWSKLLALATTWDTKDFPFNSVLSKYLKIFWGPSNGYFLFLKNKPSFCSGSCDEIHVRKKLQNKTSLKYLNFLETHLTQNTFETSLASFWNCLETHLKHLWTSLRYTYLKLPWITIGGIWEHP